MGPVALQDLHRLERRGDVAGHAQVVAVQVQRVRQAQLVDDAGQARDDLRRRHLAVAGDRLGEPLGVLAPLPGRDAAGVDRLHAVGLGRPDVPGHDVPGPLGLAGLEQVEHDLVVGHQHAAALSTMGVSRSSSCVCLARQDRHGRLVDGGVAHAGVEVAGGEGGGRRPAEPHPPLGRVEERERLAAGVSGVIARAKLSAAPATWVWTSTPPGKTTMPVASIVRPPSTSATIRPSRDADVPDLAVDAVGGVVDLPAGDPQHRVVYADERRAVRGRRPGRLGGHGLADAAEHLLVRRVRRLQRRPQRQRDLVHAVDRARAR